MTISFEITDDVYQRAAQIAQAQKMSIDQVFAIACAEHVAAWERLELRALLGDREKFQKILATVPDVEPDERDRI